MLSENDHFEERVHEGRFRGRTVIVTGAASGIGRATTLRIGREGGLVVATDLSEDGLTRLKDEHPELDLVTVAGDVSDERTVQRVLELAHGAVTGLVNNAGVMDEFEPVHELTDETWDRVLRVNVTGPMRMMRAVVPPSSGCRAQRSLHVRAVRHPGQRGLPRSGADRDRGELRLAVRGRAAGSLPGRQRPAGGRARGARRGDHLPPLRRRTQPHRRARHLRRRLAVV